MITFGRENAEPQLELILSRQQFTFFIADASGCKEKTKWASYVHQIKGEPKKGIFTVFAKKSGWKANHPLRSRMRNR